MRHIRQGDIVVAIGGKDRGKKGKVLKVFPKTSRAVVEGLSMVKKATRPSQMNPSGGIITKEGAIHISNLMLFCPVCNRPARSGRRTLSDGTRVRFCKRCKEII